MENKEIYKDVIGYEGIYQISNLGNVKSIDRHIYKSNNSIMLFGKKRKINVSNRQYLTVSLNKNGIKQKGLIHRLIAEAFIPNPENKPQVNHINGNKIDNRIENLEWVTNRENVSHSKLTTSKHSSFIGVSWYAKKKKWQSYIKMNGKLKHLGYFDFELDASFAYNNYLKINNIRNIYSGYNPNAVIA